MMAPAPAAIALVTSPEYLIPPSAMTVVPVSFRRPCRLADRGDLRHTRAGDHARCADRTGPNANLDRVRTCVDQSLAAVVRGNVAGQQVHVWKVLLDLAHCLQHTAAVPMRGVDGERICTCFHQAPPRAPESRPLHRWPPPHASGPARPCWHWDTSASSECP